MWPEIDNINWNKKYPKVYNMKGNMFVCSVTKPSG